MQFTYIYTVIAAWQAKSIKMLSWPKGTFVGSSICRDADKLQRGPEPRRMLARASLKVGNFQYQRAIRTAGARQASCSLVESVRENPSRIGVVRAMAGYHGGGRITRSGVELLAAAENDPIAATPHPQAVDGRIRDPITHAAGHHREACRSARSGAER